MDFKQIQVAIKHLALEKNLPEEIILDTLNTALAAAYRKDYGNKNQNIVFKLDTQTGEMEVYDTKKVVDFPEEILAEIRENGLDKKYVHGKTIEEIVEKEGGMKRQKSEDELDREMAALGDETIKYNPKTDVLLEEAKNINKKYKVGDEVVTTLPLPSDFGRMAAQTAKQVIIQKIREAERGIIFSEYKERVGELINATVQRREGRNLLIDLGKTTAIMPPEHQVQAERFNPGDRIKVYLLSVESSVKGPQIIVSRTHPQLIVKLFESEIPEIASGVIEIMAIAREAGFRSKVAVKSNDDSIDPIGSCVGQRGVRIQTIIAELSGEKIDIIEYNEDISKFIAAAMSPAKVLSVKILEGDKENPGVAIVMVPADQLSLAIGREGQNVRLAAKLTGWKINVSKEGDSEPVFTADATDEPASEVAPEKIVKEDEVTEEVKEIEEKLEKEAGADSLKQEKADKE
jgi:N utilization substance protein A